MEPKCHKQLQIELAMRWMIRSGNVRVSQIVWRVRPTWSDTKRTSEIWGVRCTLPDQSAIHNYKPDLNNKKLFNLHPRLSTRVWIQ